jgi:DNA primase
LIEDLFADDSARRAFLALATASEKETGSLLDNALATADPEAAELLERAAVADIEVDGSALARDLLAVAVRRTLAGRIRVTDEIQIREDLDARLRLEQLADPRTAPAAAESLLGWLSSRGIQSGG